MTPPGALRTRAEGSGKGRGTGEHRAGGYPPKGDLRRAIRDVPPAGAGRGWAPWAGAALGPAGRAGRRPRAAAAFPPAGIWPLAVVGPALLTVALAGRSWRGSFLVGLVFGVAFFFLMLSWVLNVAWYAWAGLAGGSAVILAVLAIGQRLLLRLPGWPVAVAGWWVAAEALRDRWPWGGFPWGRLAMSQASSAERGLGRDRGRAPADVRGRAHRRRPGLADSRRPQPSPGCAVAAGAGPGRGGGGGPGRGRGRAARRSGDRAPDGSGRRRAGQRAARP